MEIKLSSGKWTKIFSCYKDAYMTGVYTLGKQTLEFELYHPLTYNSPCIVSSIFMFNCLQANADNQKTMLQKIKDNTNYNSCYNVVTDDKGREIVEVYVQNNDVTTCYLNIRKCPNLNLIKFYNSVVPVSDITLPTNADEITDISTLSTIFTHTDANGNTYGVTIRKSEGVVWFKIILTYVAGALSTTIPNTNIPIEYRPVENVYSQRVHGYDGTTMTNTSTTFNTDGSIVVSSNLTSTTSVAGVFVTTN